MKLLRKNEKSIVAMYIDKINKSASIHADNKEFLIQFLQEVKENRIKNIFQSEEELVAFIDTIVRNEQLNDYPYSMIFKDVVSMTSLYEEDSITFREFLNLFRENGIYQSELFDLEIMAVFEHARHYFQVIQIAQNSELFKNKAEEFKRLVQTLSLYTPTDRELVTFVLYFISTYSFGNNLNKSIDECISLAKKRVGVYDDLDDAYLLKVEQMMGSAREVFKQAQKEEERLVSVRSAISELRVSLEKLVSLFDKRLENFEESVKMITSNNLEKVDKKYLEVYGNMKHDYNELLKKLLNSTEKQAYELAKDAVSKMESDAIDLSNAKKQYEEFSGREVREINKKILKELENLSIFSNMDGKQLSDLLSQTKNHEVVQTRTVEVPQGVFPTVELPDVVPEVLSCFDETIDFKERFYNVLDLKKKEEEKGTLFHQKTEEVIYLILAGRYPYLVGPSGSGKSYFVQQLSKLLGIPVINIGYIDEKFELLGNPTANGGYAATPFYRSYAYGGLAFADEIDNGVAQETNQLNAFLNNRKDASYSFPVVGLVKQHPNFRFIAAGNTKGMGGNATYNARTKMDESLLQRLEYVYFDYDTKVDNKLLENYQEWLEFITLYRQAVAIYSDHHDAVGQMTTRDIAKIVFDLECGIWDHKQILKSHFIEAKEKDCLMALSQLINDKANVVGGKAKVLIHEFDTLCDRHE